MLFNILPQDIFLPPVQHMGLPPTVTCRRQTPDMEFLRRLGVAPVIRKPDGCCQRRIQRDCCPRLSTRTTGCCKEPVPAKAREKQTTVEKASLDFRGFSPEQIKVKVTDKYVMLRGEKKNDHTSILITKLVPLPEGSDRKNIACRYENGYVTVHIPITKQKAPERRDDENPPVQGEQFAMDERRKAEFERSVKTLGDLFSSMFGLQLVEAETLDEDRHGESKDHACGKAKGEKSEEGKCKEQKFQEGISEENKCEGEKLEEQKCEAELEGKSKKSEKENHSEEGSVANTSSETIDPFSSATPVRDGEQTLVMSVCGNKPNKSDVDGFVHLQKQEEDNCLAEFPESDDEDHVTTPLTSLNDSVTEEDDEDDESTDEDDESELTEPNVFKLELDLSSYTPEQIRVVFRDDDVIVEAEREIEGDNYSETENLTRRIRVPENVEKSMLKSYFSEEGQLTVQAPYKRSDKSIWRAIKINVED